MKRISLICFVVTLSMVCTMQASPVSVADARQVATDFFSSAAPRLASHAGQSMVRLAYKAEQDRFYVFDRGEHGGFVVVSGDDRLPQVLGYGAEGDFSSADLPPAVQYWMDELDKQIAFLQSHRNVRVHYPVSRATAVEPLLTTQWNQDDPYNRYCPTYDTPNGTTVRSMTGCVATASAQLMNFYQWPPVGRGNHTYFCNVNDVTPTELSADFSQSVYRWDLMQDTYDESSSEESCDAVARLMSDVGISMDMEYGSSSGAREDDALSALIHYFGYSSRGYVLNRDYFNADEWDQFLVDEISASRPVIYTGMSLASITYSAHAFVLDGFDNEGYYHVNWGWGGRYDGYFLVSLLNPMAGENYAYGQLGLMGLVPEPRSGEVEEVLYFRTQLVPQMASVPLGGEIEVLVCNEDIQSNMLDTTGYEVYEGEDRRYYYSELILSLNLYDKDGVLRQSESLDYPELLTSRMTWGDWPFPMTLPESLEDGEYKLKMVCSLDDGIHDDYEAQDFNGGELYVKVIVRDDTAYLTDRYLSSYYNIDSYDLPSKITVDEPFTVGVNLTYDTWLDYIPPQGNMYLSVLKDGQEVAKSDMFLVKVPDSEVNSYRIELPALSQWGRYNLDLKDESGFHIWEMYYWEELVGDLVTPIYVFPHCDELVEDFESMPANSSTNDKDVPGRFTTWSFTKGGVRAPGEGRCNGTNSVMLKKGSAFYSTAPVGHNFFMAQATFFNQSPSQAKYTLEYSLDGGASWLKVSTLNGKDPVEVPAKSQYTCLWPLSLSSAQPALFRIVMVAGGSGATYVDDVRLYYIDTTGDVNGDGEVNIADVNAVIDVILANVSQASADVNGDGEINVGDINTIIDLMLGH